MRSHVEQLIASDRNWLTTLQEQYKVIVNRDGDLVSLKYNQIESPMHEPIVQECRGMVVDVANARVLAHPYNKFWSYGDAPAATIDWSTARVLEKLDGSLMILYWDPNTEAWSVASSGTPRAGGPFGAEARTFRDAFWETWHALGMKLPAYTGTCFMFELCTAGNRIVVQHDRPRLVLHGARDRGSGAEWGLGELAEVAEMRNWELVKSFPIGSIEDCLAAADALDPLACEGFIVVDAAFNRIKIKSPRYVALHHMKGEATLRRAIELWQTGEASELLTYFPEMAPAILPVHRKLDALAWMAAGVAVRFGHLERKEYAARVKHEPFAPVAFRLLGREVSIDAALAIMRASTTQALERMLEAA
jgi:hypothetical protein